MCPGCKRPRQGTREACRHVGPWTAPVLEAVKHHLGRYLLIALVVGHCTSRTWQVDSGTVGAPRPSTPSPVRPSSGLFRQGTARDWVPSPTWCSCFWGFHSETPPSCGPLLLRLALLALAWANCTICKHEVWPPSASAANVSSRRSRRRCRSSSSNSPHPQIGKEGKEGKRYIISHHITSHHLLFFYARNSSQLRNERETFDRKPTLVY